MSVDSADDGAAANESNSPASSSGAEPATRWVEADKNVRETSKWIVTTVTATAGLVFASGGFLAKGEFGPEYFWPRAFAMVLSAGAAALGLALFVSQVVKTLTPIEPTLSSLPLAVTEDVEMAPRNYLPEGVETIDDFRRQYVWWHKRAAQFDGQRQALKRELEAAQQADSPNADRIPELTEELDLAESAFHIADHNSSRFREAQDLILGRARYSQTSTSLTAGGPAMVAGGAVLVVGAACYLVAASFTPDEPEPTTQPERPVLAVLTRQDTSTGDTLWSAANLSACEEPDGTVRVLLEEGDGTVDAPWRVRTLGTRAGCQIVSFPVIGEAASTVVIPEAEIEIQYVTTTSLTPSSSTT